MLNRITRIESINQSINRIQARAHLVLDRAGLDDHITVCRRGDLLLLRLVIVVVKLAWYYAWDRDGGVN
jgi:hypothetical protein